MAGKYRFRLKAGNGEITPRGRGTVVVPHTLLDVDTAGLSELADLADP